MLGLFGRGLKTKILSNGLQVREKRGGVRQSESEGIAMHVLTLDLISTHTHAGSAFLCAVAHGPGLLQEAGGHRVGASWQRPGHMWADARSLS